MERRKKEQEGYLCFNKQKKKRRRAKKQESQMENEGCQRRICIDGQRWFACGCQDAGKSQRQFRGFEGQGTRHGPALTQELQYIVNPVNATYNMQYEEHET
jgi:hypothetical protein